MSEEPISEEKPKLSRAELVKMADDIIAKYKDKTDLSDKIAYAGAVLDELLLKAFFKIVDDPTVYTDILRKPNYTGEVPITCDFCQKQGLTLYYSNKDLINTDLCSNCFLALKSVSL